MYLSSIRLRNWGIYATAKFDFPAPTPGRNVVLIGALNGHGKTSLFKAVAVGIFGDMGLTQIERSPLNRENDQNTGRNSYGSFLSNIRHWGADEDDRSCSVQLCFTDDAGRPLEITRKWHFNQDGRYRYNSEEVQLYVGEARKPIGPPPYITGHSERISWYHEEIISRFLRPDLLRFFLFDGEEIADFAAIEEPDLVRAGVEGLLGIPFLRRLENDMKTYTRQAGKQTGSEDTIATIQRQLDQLIEKYDSVTECERKISANLAELRQEQEQVARDMAGLGVRAGAKREELIRDIHEKKREFGDSEDKLAKLLASDIALGLAGASLRLQLRKRLEAESRLHEWQTGRRQGDGKWDSFLRAVNAHLDAITPPLDEAQRYAILEGIKSTWEAVWRTTLPEGCPERLLHQHLDETGRKLIEARMNDLEAIGQSDVVAVLRRLDHARTRLEDLNAEYERLEAVGPLFAEKQKRGAALSREIQQLDQKAGDLGRQIAGLKGQITANEAELRREQNRLSEGGPAKRRCSNAWKVIDAIQEIIRDAVPKQIGEIERAMTLAYRSMAHKDYHVDRIVLGPDCDVRLMDARGREIRRQDLSAGERQLFTQALISAVSQVSGKVFPALIDTPLGRLDDQHRKGVLNISPVKAVR